MSIARALLSQFFPLSPHLFMYVCRSASAHTFVYIHLNEFVALLQVKQHFHIFLADSNLFDLSCNFGLKLRFHYS